MIMSSLIKFFESVLNVLKLFSSQKPYMNAIHKNKLIFKFRQTNVTQNIIMKAATYNNPHNTIGKYR